MGDIEKNNTHADAIPNREYKEHEEQYLKTC